MTGTVHAPVADGAAPAPARPGSVDRRLLSAVLVALAAGIAAASLLGPLVLGVLDYRTSATTENQLLGSDAAALFVLAPLTLVAALLVARGNRAGAPLATGVGVYALYTYAQIVIGQEYLRLPGNVERFFPLLLAVFVLGGSAVVLGWPGLPDGTRPVSRRTLRVAGWVLVLVSAFLVLGQHLRPMVVAWTDPQSLTEYASSPTPFWMVKLMDLGILVPVAVATGVGLLRGRAWAQRLLYPLLTGYGCVAVSVTAMAVVMIVRDDPDAAPLLAAGFACFTAALLWLAVAAYRPLFRAGPADQPEHLEVVS